MTNRNAFLVLELNKKHGKSVLVDKKYILFGGTMAPLDHCEVALFYFSTMLTLHYTILHYTTLYYSTIHYTTLHYTTLHYTTLHYTTLHYTTLHT